jgi:tetratricopeptide (TPR) repeat protein
MLRTCIATLVVFLVLPPLVPAQENGRPVEAVSFLGEKLLRPELPEAFRVRQEALLEEAKAALAAAPDDPEALIWVGRRTAYLGRYREAIDLYGEGIAAHPDYAPLYRHRGHRYISVRELAEAIDDLSRATELVEGQEDVVEPDGLPNATGIPTSTLQSNIWYHLGLAYYLQGDFEAALDAYRQDLAVSNNPDSLVATSHWLYMTLRRLGRKVEAASALEPISADMEIIENHEYHRLLLMYKGELSPEAMLAEIESGDADLSSATSGYGVGNWYLYNGDVERADKIFRRILSGGQWAAFGYIAAEAELARE